MKNSGGLEKGHVVKLIGISFPWAVVILGALLLFSSNAYNQTFGVFFKPITNNFGWTRATMSGAYAVRSLVCAVLLYLWDIGQTGMALAGFCCHVSSCWVLV